MFNLPENGMDNLTPADVFHGPGQAILERREKIKLNSFSRYDGKCITIINLVTQPEELKCLLNQHTICPTGFDDAQRS